MKKRLPKKTLIPILIVLLIILISQGLILRSPAAQQTNDERSESRADTQQLCCGEFHLDCLVQLGFDEGQKRNKFSRKYAFSCMIKCGFCGGTLTRRNWHSSSAYTKTIWQCVTATKNGKRHCPHCKGIPEEVIEKAFVKSYQLLCTDQQEVVDEFLQKVEGILNDDTSLKRLPKIEKEMADLYRRKEKLLDLRLDNNIDKDIYEKKNQELSEQLKKLQEEQERLMELGRNQDNTRTRLREFRKVLGSWEILESFDRVVFESVVEKIVIGGYNDEGVEEPLKITFVYKTGIHSNFNGKDFKPKRKNAAAVHNDAELCSYTSDEAEKLCLHSSSDTRRVCRVDVKGGEMK